MPSSARAVINQAAIQKIKEAQIRAIIETANSIKLDVDREQTVPFLNGTLDQSGFVNDSNIEREGVRIQYSAFSVSKDGTKKYGYAAKQYYVPMNHNHGKHANARDHWLDPYMKGGAKEAFVKDLYKKHIIKELRRANTI